MVRIVIVAQSIKDNDGYQMRATTGKGSDFNGSVTVDDGVAEKTCKLGIFDFYEHKTDHEKNVYFDDITGEVKMLVTLDREQGTGKLSVRKIEYIE